MPHCIIEHSSNFSGKELVANVFKGTMASNLFEPDGSDIKVRAIVFDDYQVGVSNSSFIHIESFARFPKILR